MKSNVVALSTAWVASEDEKMVAIMAVQELLEKPLVTVTRV